MEVGAEAITPGDGLVAKGLSGMASCGRRERTFSTGEKYKYAYCLTTSWLMFVTNFKVYLQQKYLL